MVASATAEKERALADPPTVVSLVGVNKHYRRGGEVVEVQPHSSEALKTIKISKQFGKSVRARSIVSPRCLF